MKIALIRSAIHRQGGVERYVWMLAGELARRGHEVHLIARRCEELPHPSVKFHRVDVRAPFSFMKVLQFASRAAMIVEHEGFDVVHSCDRIVGCDIYRAGEGVHREWLEVSARYLPGWLAVLKRLDPLHSVLLKLEKFLIQEGGARRVTAISRRGAEEIERHFGLGGVPVIYNGVDPEEFRPPAEGEREAARAEMGVPEEAFVVLYVGSGFFRKGLSYLIEGFSRLEGPEGRPPWLIAAGRGSSRPYVRQARALGVSGRVRFTGSAIPAPRLYRGADVFVFPTLYEPFGNVCLEALASGLPCVFSSRSGGAEIVEEGESALILPDPTDAGEMARLIGLLMDGERAASMGRAARALSLKFSLGENADRTEAIYREVAEEKTRERESPAPGGES
jgi:UDP-glucose:(heptosyl)LPS alpha-1,3-glucosyltransferase